MVGLSFRPVSFTPLISHSQSYGGYGGSYGGGGGGGGGWGGGGGGYEDKMSNLGGGLRNVDWASTKLTHFEKNFYVEDKRVKERSDKEIDEFKRLKEIKVWTYPSPFARLCLTLVWPYRYKAAVCQDQSPRSMKSDSRNIL